MKFMRMIFVNCKKYLKNYKNIVIMFIVPILVVGMVQFFTNNSSEGLDAKVAIVNLDKGSLGKGLIEELGVNSVFDSKEKAIKELKNYNVVAVYVISDNFTEKIHKGVKPKVTAYKLEQGNSTQVFEAQLEEKLNKLVKVQILESSNIIKDKNEIDNNIIRVQYNLSPGVLDSDGFMPIVLIMFFIVTFSANISIDLLTLRKEKILERFLSTNNKGYQIMGSIYISMVIVQVFMFLASFIVMDVLFKLAFQNFGILILNIGLMSMVSVSLGVMIIRIFKEPGVASIVINMISMAMFFLYIVALVGETSSKVPRIIITLSKFTPFYWALGSIDKSVLFPNVFVLLLLALVFFSAGSIRYSNFAKKM
ncbi:ABC transporter permease [Clostridium akagii]|uniref:ABC transporter permease n=1 Tax=Clostridium akagii TaxID=91623 RepID=UPI00047A7E7F|nr:ABC transporter permease [Clostridium akagii]